MKDPFPTTRWSLILDVDAHDAECTNAALEWLGNRYWFPLYSLVRRRGHGHEDACELVQSFFVELIEKRTYLTADPHAGRFRQFLSHVIKQFLLSRRSYEQARKRQASTPPVSLDEETARVRYEALADSGRSPEEEFELQWAREVIDRVVGRLEDEATRRGNGPTVEALMPFLRESQRRGAVARVATELGRTEGAIKVAIHRLRKRFGELLRAEIAETVSDPDLVDAEIRHLLRVLEQGSDSAGDGR